MYKRTPYNRRLAPTSQSRQVRYEQFTNENNNLDELSRRVHGIDKYYVKKRYNGNTDHMKLQWNNQLTDHN